MREILFRGKRLCNGKWMIGNLLCYEDGDCHIVIDNFGLNHYRVDPETVGQFVGLTDENGKKIFEGDIVRYSERRLGGEDVPVVNVVEFAEGGFAVNNYFINHWLWNSIDGNTQLSDIEVIGNIHDNPELLEVE